MKKSGEVLSKSLTLTWEVELTPGRTRMEQAANNVTVSMDFGARASVAAQWRGSTPSPSMVGAGFINILQSDRKEFSYRHKDLSRRTGHHQMTLRKTGPLWDPSPAALQRKNEVFPFSQPVVAIALDGRPQEVTRFDDRPFVMVEREFDDQELYWVDGRTVFLIALSVIVQFGDDQEEIIPFRHNWTIDWRLRPQVNGWASLGEPMAFEVSRESAEEAIGRMSPDKTANEEDATMIPGTWNNLH